MIVKNSIPVLFDKLSPFWELIHKYKRQGLKLGFVPTMGALHDGHITLVKKAAQENDVVVVSIFVNPTQFNNPDDLRNYPRTIQSDLDLLSDSGCNLVLAPSMDEVYPGGTDLFKLKLDLGFVSNTMEGRFRPGHFDGVVQVVNRLFEIVEMDNAYFGEKDFQQLAIIREMVRQLNLSVKIIACPTVREGDGLAMSSRNVLLDAEQRKAAPKISETLFYIRDNWSQNSVQEIRDEAIRKIEQNGLLKVEYLEIVDSKTLHSISHWDESSFIRCCTAVQVGKVRLIDNVEIVTAGN